MNFSPFSAPFSWGTRYAKRPLLPKRVGALWEGPPLFGRNRESRTREAAGRRNWPEAVPRKMCGRKSPLNGLSENRERREQRSNGKPKCSWRSRTTLRERIGGKAHQRRNGFLTRE